MKKIDLLDDSNPKDFRFKSFEAIGPNEKGRDYFVGDIHGTFDVLKKAMKAIGFDESKDRLFCTGDLFDRGKYEHLVMDFLGQPWFFCIMGNHDQFLVSRFLDVKARLPDIQRSLEGVKASQEEKNALIKKTLKDNMFASHYPFALKMSMDEFESMMYHMLELPTLMEVRDHDGTIGMVHAEMMGCLSWEDFVSFVLGIEEVNERDHDHLLDCVRWGGRIDYLFESFIPYFHTLYPTKEGMNGEEKEISPPHATMDDIRKTGSDLKLLFSGHNIMPVEDKSFFKEGMRCRLNNRFDNMVFIDHGSFVAHNGEMNTNAFGLGIYDTNGDCILFLDSEKL